MLILVTSLIGFICHFISKFACNFYIVSVSSISASFYYLGFAEFLLYNCMLRELLNDVSLEYVLENSR